MPSQEDQNKYADIAKEAVPQGIMGGKKPPSPGILQEMGDFVKEKAPLGEIGDWLKDKVFETGTDAKERIKKRLEALGTRIPELDKEIKQLKEEIDQGGRKIESLDAEIGVDEAELLRKKQEYQDKRKEKAEEIKSLKSQIKDAEKEKKMIENMWDEIKVLKEKLDILTQERQTLETKGDLNESENKRLSSIVNEIRKLEDELRESENIDFKQKIQDLDLYLTELETRLRLEDNLKEFDISNKSEYESGKSIIDRKKTKKYNLRTKIESAGRNRILKQWSQEKLLKEDEKLQKQQLILKIQDQNLILQERFIMRADRSNPVFESLNKIPQTRDIAQLFKDSIKRPVKALLDKESKLMKMSLADLVEYEELSYPRKKKTIEEIFPQIATKMKNALKRENEQFMNKLRTHAETVFFFINDPEAASLFPKLKPQIELLRKVNEAEKLDQTMAGKITDIEYKFREIFAETPPDKSKYAELTKQVFDFQNITTEIPKYIGKMEKERVKILKEIEEIKDGKKGLKIADIHRDTPDILKHSEQFGVSGQIGPYNLEKVKEAYKLMDPTSFEGQGFDDIKSKPSECQKRIDAYRLMNAFVEEFKVLKEINNLKDDAEIAREEEMKCYPPLSDIQKAEFEKLKAGFLDQFPADATERDAIETELKILGSDALRLKHLTEKVIPKIAARKHKTKNDLAIKRRESQIGEYSDLVRIAKEEVDQDLKSVEAELTELTKLKEEADKKMDKEAQKEVESELKILEGLKSKADKEIDEELKEEEKKLRANDKIQAAVSDTQKEDLTIEEIEKKKSETQNKNAENQRENIRLEASLRESKEEIDTLEKRRSELFIQLSTDGQKDANLAEIQQLNERIDRLDKEKTRLRSMQPDFAQKAGNEEQLESIKADIEALEKRKTELSNVKPNETLKEEIKVLDEQINKAKINKSTLNDKIRDLDVNTSKNISLITGFDTAIAVFGKKLPDKLDEIKKNLQKAKKVERKDPKTGIGTPVSYEDLLKAIKSVPDKEYFIGYSTNNTKITRDKPDGTTETIDYLVLEEKIKSLGNIELQKAQLLHKKTIQVPDGAGGFNSMTVNEAEEKIKELKKEAELEKVEEEKQKTEVNVMDYKAKFDEIYSTAYDTLENGDGTAPGLIDLHKSYGECEQRLIAASRGESGEDPEAVEKELIGIYKKLNTLRNSKLRNFSETRIKLSRENQRIKAEKLINKVYGRLSKHHAWFNKTDSFDNYFRMYEPLIHKIYDKGILITGRRAASSLLLMVEHGEKGVRFGKSYKALRFFSGKKRQFRRQNMILKAARKGEIIGWRKAIRRWEIDRFTKKQKYLDTNIGGYKNNIETMNRKIKILEAEKGKVALEIESWQKKTNKKPEVIEAKVMKLQNKIIAIESEIANLNAKIAKKEQRIEKNKTRIENAKKTVEKLQTDEKNSNRFNGFGMAKGANDYKRERPQYAVSLERQGNKQVKKVKPEEPEKLQQPKEQEPPAAA